MTNEDFTNLVYTLFGPDASRGAVASWLSKHRRTSPSSVSNWMTNQKPIPAWIDVMLTQLVEDRRDAIVQRIKTIEAFASKLATPASMPEDVDIQRMRRRKTENHEGMGDDTRRSQAERLRQAGETLFGDVWQTELARQVSAFHPKGTTVAPAVVRHWLLEYRKVPAWAWDGIAELLVTRSKAQMALADSMGAEVASEGPRR